jgi:phage tail protein X
MAKATLVAKMDDMLDYLVWKHYRKQSGYVEAVLDSPDNYRIASLPELLPLGTQVVMPDVTVVDPPVKLWED